MKMGKLAALFWLVLALFRVEVHAVTRIAVLDFELNDITSLPNTPAERLRTASMAPLLSRTLIQAGDYLVSVVDADSQQAANAGFAYLFRHHDLAAQLGRRQGADWIIVSQHSKPSFLFSYLWVYLIDVKKQVAVARYDIELKGNHQTVTEHGLARLAGKVAATIAAYGKE